MQKAAENEDENTLKLHVYDPTDLTIKKKMMYIFLL